MKICGANDLSNNMQFSHVQPWKLDMINPFTNLLTDFMYVYIYSIGSKKQVRLLLKCIESHQVGTVVCILVRMKSFPRF